jgi:hypothetical protein
MSQQLNIKRGVIEAIATDRKPGYTLKIRVLNSDIKTDARILDLRYVPCSIILEFEDILTLEPVIDYSDMDAEFDPDREDDDVTT